MKQGVIKQINYIGEIEIIWYIPCNALVRIFRIVL